MLTGVIDNESNSKFIKFIIDNRIDLILTINMEDLKLENFFKPNECEEYSEKILRNNKMIANPIQLIRKNAAFKLKVS